MLEVNPLGGDNAPSSNSSTPKSVSRRSVLSSVPLVDLRPKEHESDVKTTLPILRSVVETSGSEASHSLNSKGSISCVPDTMESVCTARNSPLATPSARIKHLARTTDETSRFPKLDECAHFHYDNVELGAIVMHLCDEQTDFSKIPPTLANGTDKENDSNKMWFCVEVTCNGRSWTVRRSYENFQMLDKQLHRCVYDRKFSFLTELPTVDRLPDDIEKRQEAVRRVLREYLSRFSNLAGSLISCGPVLNWLELDNRGNRLIVTNEAAINTPAIAGAYVIKGYTAQAPDEISFEIGDMVSVIDMPPPEESTWWRGKRRFEVGFFPSECVEVIGEKIPQVFKIPTVPTKPVLRKQGKLIAFFRSFLLSRPSRRKLKQSGILKERVFGCDLGEHLLNTSREIPLVLKCCTEFIETHGIVDGVYRLSGVTSNIQKLRLAFDEDRAPDLNDEAILQDIHCVASLLKMYFRELPNPLLTYQLYDKFVSAVQAEEDVRLLRLRDVVQQLPPPHYRTLEFLVRHLAKVASCGNQTSMTPKNIAIVWAPNLLRSKDVEGGGGVGALHVVGVQAVLTEYLIRYVDLIFNNKLPVFHSPTFEQDSPRKQRPKSLAISTPTKLLSLEEARVKALSSNLPIFQQKYIDVGGGPDNLPAKYHTILEFPTSSKRSSGKGKKSPSGWKSFFSRGWHSGSAREKDRGSQRPISNPRKASTGSLKYTTTVLPLQENTVIETDGHSKKLRAVKSAESLISSLPSNGTSCRNSQVSESSGSAEEDNMNWSSRSSKKNENSQHPSPYKSPNVHSSHIRSLSHDSYFEKSVDISNEQIDEENEENVFLQIDSKLNFSWKDSNASETRGSTELLPFSLDTMFKKLKDAETMGGQEKCFSVDGRHSEKDVGGLCDEFFMESQDTFQKKKLRCSDSDVSSSKMQKLNFQNFHQAFSSPSFSNKLESSVTFSDEDSSPSIGKEMDNHFVQGSIEETKDWCGQTLSLDMLNKKYSPCSIEEKPKNAMIDLQVNDRIEVHQKAGKELSGSNSCTVENNVDKKPVKLLTVEETMLPSPVSDTVEVDDGVGKTVVERYGNEETIIVEVHATHEGSSDEDESHHIACNTQQTASGKREEGELQKFQTRGEQNLDCSSNLVQSFSAKTTLSNSVSLSQLESSQDFHQGTLNLTDKSNICHSSSFPEECSVNNSVLLDLVKLPDKSEGKQHNLERDPQAQTSPLRNFFLGECSRFIPEINQTDSKEPVFSSSSVSLEDGDQEISDVEELFKYKLLDEQETLNTPINRMQMNEASPLKNQEVHGISSDFSDLAEKDNVSTVHVPPPIFPSYCSLEWNKENNVKSCPFEQESKCSDALRRNTCTHTATIDKDVHPTFILDNLESSKPQEALMKQNFCEEEVCDNSLRVNSHMITKEQVKSHHQDASDFENVVSLEMQMNETDSSAQIPNITSNQKFEISDSQHDWSDSAIEKCSIYEQSPPVEESRCKFESEIEKSIKRDYQIKVKMEQVQAKNNKKYPSCDSKFSSTPKQVQKIDSSKEHTKDEKKMLDGVELRKYPGRQLEKFSEDHEIDKKWNVDSHVTFYGANRSSMSTERKRLSEPAMTNMHPKFIPMDKKDSVRTLLSKFETPSKKENSSVSETNFQETARNYLNESLKKNKLSSTHLFSQIKVFKPQSEQSTGTASIKYDPLSDPILEHDIHPQDLLQIHTSTPNAGKLEVQKALSWGPEEMSVTTMNYAKKSLDYVKPQTLNFENVLHQDHMSKKQGNSKAFSNSSIQDKEDKDSETQELLLPLGKKGDLESPTHLVSQNRKTNISPVKWHSFSPLSSPIREVTPFLPVNSIIRNQKEQVCYLKEDHRSWDKERWKSDTNNKLRRMNSEPEYGCQTSLGQDTSLSSTIDNQGGASESMHTKNEVPPVSSVFEDEMDKERGEVWVRERAQRWQKHISEKMGYVPLSHSSNHCGPKSFSEGLNSTNKLGGSPWKREQKPPIVERQLLKSPVKKTPESLPLKMKPIPAPRTSLVKKNVILDEGSENVPNVALSEETTCRVASVDMCEEGKTSHQQPLSAPKCIRDRAAMFEHSATSPQKSLAQSSNNHSSKH